MYPTLVFGADVLFTLIVCIGLVLYLAKDLRSLLIELCGTAERANFWLAFSNVALVVVPLIFALDYTPVGEPNRAVVFEIAGQLKYAFIGFIVTFVSLALILLWFIPRDKAGVAVRATR